MKHQNEIRDAADSHIDLGFVHDDDGGWVDVGIDQVQELPHPTGNQLRRVDLSCILFPYGLDRSIVWVSLCA
ncbi:MAG: hypothetical protein F6K30_10150 [Cyanothece sp. SIO2G6]|nr:hypothetical protein [Cyanothece sp. SIO2G6]